PRRADRGPTRRRGAAERDGNVRPTSPRGLPPMLSLDMLQFFGRPSLTRIVINLIMDGRTSRHVRPRSVWPGPCRRERASVRVGALAGAAQAPRVQGAHLT